MKKILVLAVLIALVLAGMLYSRNKTVAPASEQGAKKETLKKEQQKNNNSNENKNMQLEIKITKEGTGEREVKAGDTVFVKYTGKLEDGTVFDATSRHGDEPFSFQVGAGLVIKGWDQGLLGMKVGEQRTLTIPSDLAYGPSGIPGVIPGGATLIFEIELVSIK